jgi:Zn-dependent protease/CBS domain-containing protein
MSESVRIGRIAGIAVGFNWSLLVIFWLLTWSLAAGEFPDANPGYSDATYWFAALVTGLVFFACLLAHELGHALMARRLGMEVEGITLWLFGGVAKLGGEAATPRAELQVGAIGPAVSLAAAAVFGVAALGLDGFGVSGLAVTVPAWLARINAILAVFNLVPAYPLDGGRVLRALLWSRHGDRVRATATAARAGRTFAHVLIGLGLVDFAFGASAGGLWFVFLGWFLLLATRAEESGVLTRELLGGLRVRDVMSPDPVVAPASITVAELVDHYALRHRCSAFPLVDDDGRLVGLVTLSRVKAVPADHRRLTSVGSLACPLVDVPVAGPDDAVVDLLERMAASPDGRALVLEGDRLVGIVSPTDVARILQVATLRETAR